MAKSININLILNFINKHKMTIKEFCRYCGISYHTYRNMMNQENKRISRAIFVAIAIGVNVDELLLL